MKELGDSRVIAPSSSSLPLATIGNSSSNNSSNSSNSNSNNSSKVQYLKSVILKLYNAILVFFITLKLRFMHSPRESINLFKRYKPEDNPEVLDSTTNTNTNNTITRASTIIKINTQRMHIANELLDTEKKYIQSLQILNLLFLLPLKEAAKNDKALISEAEQRFIFSYIEAILNLHTTFCKELEEAVGTGGEMNGIGLVFLKNWEFFKMYSSYINGYNVSLATLSNCKQNYPLFEKFVEVTESNPICAKLDLASYLIMPVQRLPRYILLLNDLLKHTPTTMQGYASLQKSLDNLRSVTLHLNESKRIAENAQKVFEIQQSLSGKTQTIMEPHRVFHSEGNCIVRTTTSKIKNMHYFLFNDMILFASPAGASLFNKVAWRVHFQLLLADLTFSILCYEKGLLVTGANLKIVIILDDLQQTQVFLDTLQSLKEKIPSIGSNGSLKTTTKSLSNLLKNFLAPFPSLSSSSATASGGYKRLLPVFIVVLSVLIMHWKYWDNTTKNQSPSVDGGNNKHMYGPGLKFKLD